MEDKKKRNKSRNKNRQNPNEQKQYEPEKTSDLAKMLPQISAMDVKEDSTSKTYKIDLTAGKKSAAIPSIWSQKSSSSERSVQEKQGRQPGHESNLPTTASVWHEKPTDKKSAAIPSIWSKKPSSSASITETQSVADDIQEPKKETTSIVDSKPSGWSQKSKNIGTAGQQLPPQNQAWKRKEKKTLTPQSIADDVTVPKPAISAPIALLKSASSVSESSLELMTMEGQGTLGANITIETNHLPINVQNLIDSAHHYIFEVDPDKPKRLIKQVFQTFYKKNFASQALAFDGVTNIYTPNKLPIPNDNFEDEITIMDEENRKEKKYKIKLRKTKEVIDLRPIRNYQKSNSSDQLKALQCLNIILNSPLYQQLVSGKRTFFYRPNNPPDLGEGSELYVGIFQSFFIGARPYLNVDISNKQFPKAINCIDFIKECDSYSCRINLKEGLDSRAIFEVSKLLKNLRVIYKIPNEQTSRSYKINGLGETSEKLRFKLSDGKEISILEYFAKMKNYKIIYPKMPTLSIGAEIKKMYVPAELCQIAPLQLINKQSSDNQKAKMIRYTAISTIERKMKIMDILKMSNHNASPILQKFGIRINITFDKIPARILDPPKLKYLNKSIMPRNGVWRADNAQFLKTNYVHKWAVLSLVQRIVEKNVTEFAKMLIQGGRQQGIEMATPDITFETPRIPDNKLANILDNYKRNQFNIVVIILEDFGNSYSRVKQQAELKCGVLTQCIKNKTIMNTVQKNNFMTVNQLLLKINTKLNGMNHDLAAESKIGLYNQKFMIIGADVTHPSPDQRSIPSVVGAVCSFDGMKYQGTWRLQNPMKEMIVDFKTIIYDFILLFKEQNKNNLPDKILYYRDGVSEGDFKNVMNVELRAMYAACASIKPNYKPAITFIIVQKRHHTRFFPIKDDGSKFNNCSAGTIVDTDIVPLNEFQFFLLSHTSIQGVGRPTKYCLLWDDSKFSINDLETLTYNLCHVFTRCNRSVSYVAPTYYAHLFAYRGRVYVEGQKINFDNLDRTFKDLAIKKEIVHDFPMYFV